MASKCDIVRDMVAATTCGLCGPPAAGRPAACGAALAPALCGVAGAANARMALFAARYSPANLYSGEATRAGITLAERIYLTKIRDAEQALAAAYPSAAPGAASISWPDFEACLWTPAGTPGGPGGRVYFGRADLQMLGMAPVHPVGGAAAQGAVWKPPAASPLPVAIDYVMNPDLAAILVFALAVVVFAVLLWRGLIR